MRDDPQRLLNTETFLYSVRLRATRDFTVGPNRLVVVQKGEVCQVCDFSPEDPNAFFINLKGGGFFGWCHIGDGWERVDSSPQT